MSGMSRRGADRASRLARAAALSGTSGKVCPADRATLLLEAIIEPGDRVTIEGDNQKQADFLASALAKVDPGAGARSAHGAVRAGAARPSRRVRARNRQPAGFRLCGAAKPQARRTGRRERGQDRRDPHLSRTLCPHAGGPDAAASRWSSPTRPIATEISTPARTPKIRRPSPRRRRSAAASSSRRSMRSWTGCRGSTFPATGSMSWCRARRPI